MEQAHFLMGWLWFASEIDKQGKLVINPQFGPGLLSARSFADGLAAIRIGDDKTGKYGYIDKQGKMVISPQFDYTSEFAEGLVAVRIGANDNGKWGYVSR